MKGHLRMAFFIKHISEYNRHAFRCWRCWQRISCNISDTSHEIIALTNVDKGSHLDEILWYALPTVDNHDSIYYSYPFLEKKQYSVLQLLAVIIFERFTHRFPCQRCQPSNICLFQNERTYILIRHDFVQRYYVGNKVFVTKGHVFPKYLINSLIFHCLMYNFIYAFDVLLSAKKCLYNGFTQEVLRD